MKSKYPKFSQRAFNEADQLAKNAVGHYLCKKGYHIKSTSTFGPDFLLTNGHYIEAGIKYFGWTSHGTFWPNTIHVTERQSKYRKPGVKLTYFFCNPNCTHAVIVPASALQQEYLKEVPNCRVAEGELMFDVPISLCHVIALE